MTFDRINKISVMVLIGGLLFNTGLARADSCLRPATVGENSDKAGKLKEELNNNKKALLDTEEKIGRAHV